MPDSKEFEDLSCWSFSTFRHSWEFIKLLQQPSNFLRMWGSSCSYIYV